MNYTTRKVRAMFLVVFLIMHYSYAEDAKPEENIAVPDNLSLQDLLTMEINTGSFLDLDLSKSPLSMTIITRDMVKTSGARNMSELLEIYVPGTPLNCRGDRTGRSLRLPIIGY